MLKDDPDPLPQPPQRLAVQVCDIDALDQNTSGRGALEQIQHPQQRAFAGARTADDSEHLARADAEVDSLQGFEGGCRSVVGFSDAAGLDHSPPILE